MTNHHMRPMGGSDIMELGLRKRLGAKAENINIFLSRCLEDLIIPEKKNVIWQHLNIDEPLTRGMQNKFFTRSIDAFVYVSHWQYEKFRYVYNCPTRNAFVLKNAIEPISYTEKLKTEKIKIIYTSTPWRGLDILLDSFALLNRDDAELHVYSSTKIYGTDYDNAHAHIYKPLFEKAASQKNVIYHGYASNSEVIEALGTSHIYAYPSIFEETSCLSLIEAGAAGCKIVTTNLGAIPETCSEFATYIPIQRTKDDLALSFAKFLDQEINTFWNTQKQDALQKQRDFFNYYYSWERRVVEWENLIDNLFTD